MGERIKTLHPEGKKGVNIEREKYEQIKAAILGAIENTGQISYSNMNKFIKAQLHKSFDGSIPWYVETVKLDLEARGIIERIPNTSPQMLVIK